uniref:Putative DNA binding, helix-turn-helix domain containing protein n=1 Tax=viral metagenome TaxID=1070528 RepID=A0A6M3XI55_9ZZZZ
MNEKNRIRARMVELYGNQTGFARAAGVSVARVSRVLRGRRQMTPAERFHWAALLGLDESIFGSDPPGAGTEAGAGNASSAANSSRV